MNSDDVSGRSGRRKSPPFSSTSHELDICFARLTIEVFNCEDEDWTIVWRGRRTRNMNARALPFIKRKVRAERIRRLELRLFDCKKKKWVELTPTTMERSS